MTQLKDFSLLVDKQLETQKKLLELERLKTPVIAKGDIEQLGSLLKLEQPLVMHSAALERRREAMKRELEAAGKSFESVVQNQDPEKTLETGLAELADTAGQLKRVLHINLGILNARQRSIARMLTLLGAQEQPVTYGRDGQINPQAGNV
jgi:flagellar biosynthesis/type III secretory pathway chaperone